VDIVVYLLLLGLWGLVVGAFARLALPGRDPMSLWATMGVGIAGSLIAGIVFWLISDGSSAPGFLASLVFATLIVYVIRRSRGGGLTRPGRSGRERRP
jgi:uncharacterized membrane protein YeaQ/YmgE (transglycosylase-associated protein family)